MNKEIVTSDGCRIHYRCHGKRNHTALLLLNGLGGNSNVWNEYIQNLEKSYYVITIDYRGFGLSDRPQNVESYHMERFVDDLQCVLDQEQIREHAVLGHSFGGFLALHHACRSAQRVSHIIIIQSSLANSVLWKRLASLLPVNAILESLLQIAPTYHWKRYQNFSRYKNKWELEPVHILNDIIHASFFSYVATLYNHQNYSSEEIGTHPAQTMLITGKKDILYPANQVYELKSILPNHTVVEYDDNHLLPINNPALIIDNIRTFIPTEADTISHYVQSLFSIDVETSVPNMG